MRHSIAAHAVACRWARWDGGEERVAHGEMVPGASTALQADVEVRTDPSTARPLLSLCVNYCCSWLVSLCLPCRQKGVPHVIDVEASRPNQTSPAGMLDGRGGIRRTPSTTVVRWMRQIDMGPCGQDPITPRRQAFCSISDPANPKQVAGPFAGAVGRHFRRGRASHSFRVRSRVQ